MYNIERIKRVLKNEDVDAETTQHIVKLLENKTQDLVVRRTRIYENCVAAASAYLEVMFDNWRLSNKEQAQVPLCYKKKLMEQAKTAAEQYAEYIVNIENLKERKNEQE